MFYIVCDNAGGRYWYQRGSAMGFRIHECFATKFNSEADATNELATAKSRAKRSERANIKAVPIAA